MTTETPASELTKTGISVIGDVRWGSHFCVFYETKQDLLDTLVLYFKAGLENNELCLWVVSPPLTVEEAKRALGQAVSELDRHLSERGLEIHAHDEWYLRKERCDPQRVLERWSEKLKQALAAGYAGLRASGDGGWVQKDDWMVFREYEEELDALMADQRRIILCTYPLTTTPGDQTFDVARIHQVAVARRHGSWEMVETPELKEAKAEIKKLNDELERQVEERTRELATINEALRSEIAERKLAAEAVKQAEDRIRLIIDTIPTMAWSLGPDGAVDFVNQRWMEYTGLSLEEEIEEPTRAMHPEELPSIMEKWLANMAAGEPFEDEMRLRRADGEYRWFLVRTAPLRDEHGNILKWFGSSIDIEDRKQAQKDLEEANRQLKLLSRRRVKVQEEERRHLARELHDEIGQALTAAKINLQAAMEESNGPKFKRIRETAAILDRLLGLVRQISLNLRPSMLDDLGLVPALRSLVDEQGRRASIQIRFSAKDIPENLDPETRITFFRIAQEAMTNAVRHANATQINVDLGRKNGNLRLRVRDNGRGFDAESTQAQTVGLGLLGIKERAALVGGRARIMSSPGKGTTVDATLPLTSQSERQNHNLGK
jgi:PAS domain S-box-containing protein